MTFKLFGRLREAVGARRGLMAGLSGMGMLCFAMPVDAQQTTGSAAMQSKVKDPLIATYDGGQISFRDLEIYTREMPVGQRVSFARNVDRWREMMAGELAKMTALTSQAKTLGLHLDPGFLRARDYFVNEYMSYLILRNHLQNKFDLSSEAQTREYETHKPDFWSSATVSFRMIRSRDEAALTSAAQSLAQGADFVEIEKSVSQVSPRYRGTMIGPFPTTEQRAGIPPPDEVVATAMALDEGQTTGPFEVKGFHYIVKTEKKTEGRQKTQDEVPELLEQRLRDKQTADILPQLITRIQTDLGAVVDEELFASNSTRSDDVLATLGTVRITRGEYTDLNGSVRGPATAIAHNMPTPLKRFVLPYMLSEWAKSRGYLDLPETKRAIEYYDLQHLAAKVEMEISLQIMPLPTEEEMRAKFEKNIDDYRTPSNPNPKFEDHHQDMMNIVIQGRAQESGDRVRALVLNKINFRMAPNPGPVDNITAYEAVREAADVLTSGMKLLDISAAAIPQPAEHGGTDYIDFGRAPKWRILYEKDGQTSSVEISGPAPLLMGQNQYSHIAALAPWEKLWRFDTDSLKRHAIDKEFGDFVARYDNRVKVAARVDFEYSADDPTSPTESRITYTAVPVDPNIKDGFEVTYDGQNGEVLRRVYGHKEDRCLTCPDGKRQPAAAPSDDNNFSTSADDTKTTTAAPAGETI